MLVWDFGVFIVHLEANGSCKTCVENLRKWFAINSNPKYLLSMHVWSFLYTTRHHSIYSIYSTLQKRRRFRSFKAFSTLHIFWRIFSGHPDIDSPPNSQQLRRIFREATFFFHYRWVFVWVVWSRSKTICKKRTGTFHKAVFFARPQLLHHRNRFRVENESTKIGRDIYLALEFRAD